MFIKLRENFSNNGKNILIMKSYPMYHDLVLEQPEKVIEELKERINPVKNQTQTFSLKSYQMVW